MYAAAVYFLADVHLSPQKPEITAAFFRTLTALSHDGCAVFILGDLFDYWLGDDLMNDFHHDIAAKIAALPCEVYYQHGNRDFLIGEHFAERARMAILPERFLLSLGDQIALLEHGDLLCTDDRGYQILRKILRHRLIQRLYFALPRALKDRLARALRQKSRSAQAKKAAHIIDTNRNEIHRVLAAKGADVLIHGHTHRADVYFLGQKKVFVLGDFRPSGKMLRYENGQFALISTP